MIYFLFTEEDFDGFIKAKTNKKEKQVDTTIQEAFKRVTGLVIAEAGNLAQDDCITLGKAIGYTEEELKQDFPGFYSSEVFNADSEDFYSDVAEGGEEQDQEPELEIEEEK